MAFEYPDDLRYQDTHEYVRIDGEIATIGITEFAIDQLGDIVYLELSEIGEALKAGQKFGTIESVKAVEDLNSPVTGTVIERNEELINSPDSIVDDPYGEGWFIKVRVHDPEEVEDGMTANDYKSLVEGL
jgi:glycine cleavage system H protein